MAIYDLHQVEKLKNLNQSKQYTTLMWVILYSLLFFLFLESIFLFILRPYFVIKQILVAIDKEIILDIDIQNYLETLKDQNIFTLNLEPIKTKLNQWPAIKDIRFNKQYPQSMKVFIQFKEVIAILLVRKENNIDNLYYLSPEAQLFYFASQNIKQVPIIVFNEYNDLSEGSYLDSQGKYLINQLNQLKKEAPLLYDTISELELLSNELIVYNIFYSKGILIKLFDFNSTKLKEMLLIWDTIQKEDILIENSWIDFRKEKAIY